MMNMMKVFAFATAMMASTLSFASYGVIDFAKVIDNNTYLKQQKESLNQTIQPIGKKLEQLSKELQALQEKAAKEQGTMKEEEKKRLEQQFQTKLTDFNKAQQELQVKIQQGTHQMNSTLDSRIVQVADQLRVEHKLDAIFERGSLVSYDKKFDLTDKMIQKLNAIK